MRRLPFWGQNIGDANFPWIQAPVEEYDEALCMHMK